MISCIEEWDAQHVVLAGGEPMLFAELIPLAAQLRQAGWHVTVETAGTLYLPVACDLMSISPKLAASGPEPAQHPRWSRRHQRQRYQPKVLRSLMDQYDYQLKFVVDRAAELDEVESFVAAFPAVREDRVMLMPQGVTQHELVQRATWLEPYCRERGWKFCPRKQIEWFGPVRRT